MVCTWYNRGNEYRMPGRVVSTPGASHREVTPVTNSQSTFPLPDPQEEWRPVVGWEGHYEVSNIGRVRRVGRAMGAKTGRIRKTPINPQGYPVVDLWKDQRAVLRRVHRLVAEAFLGPCPPGKEVHHIDGNRANPAVTNLAYVTKSENARFSFALGRVPMRGCDAPSAKLTAEQVIAIRRSTELLRVLARRYGITESAVSAVRRGKTYREIGV